MGSDTGIEAGLGPERVDLLLPVNQFISDGGSNDGDVKLTTQLHSCFSSGSWGSDLRSQPGLIDGLVPVGKGGHPMLKGYSQAGLFPIWCAQTTDGLLSATTNGSNEAMGEVRSKHG